MSLPDDSFLPYSLLQFYATSPYPCSYLPEQEARSQVATPTHLIDGQLYSLLVRQGFRRSGLFTYRPWCDRCHACIPVRIPVERFQPSRTQRKVWSSHSGIQARELPVALYPDHFALYQRYQASRHPGGGMDHDDREQYAQFLLQSRVDTRLVEFIEDGQLRMVSLIDVLSDGLSSVYTFFDPELPGYSLGTYNILWQTLQCQQQGLPYLYLGYWIEHSRKMAYKARFKPLEGLVDGQWRELQPTAEPPLSSASATIPGEATEPPR